MNDDEELEFQMELVKKGIDEAQLDYAMFAHKSVQCIYEIINQIPNGIQYYLLSDMSNNSKMIVKLVRNIMVQYYELENVRESIISKNEEKDG